MRWARETCGNTLVLFRRVKILYSFPRLKLRPIGALPAAPWVYFRTGSVGKLADHVSLPMTQPRIAADAFVELSPARQPPTEGGAGATQVLLLVPESCVPRRGSWRLFLGFFLPFSPFLSTSSPFLSFYQHANRCSIVSTTISR